MVWLRLSIDWLLAGQYIFTVHASNQSKSCFVVIPSAFRVSFRVSTLWRPFLPSLSVSLVMVAVYSEISPVGWISIANLSEKNKQITFSLALKS